ncbi:hypothetical protein OOK58_09895 [Streptomyces sp. NBC_01728]|uniref:hypothetical protein n=1 Tax=unclassified Streptomyces TaxID=2593676 RepID=UPI00224FAB9F|nr:MULTISPECIES: hypothetical protein [unclassified Streptomyces]MCX4452418.1 hypothetical protein [Streptomyces sp. NBC_01719]MCX4491778.1 hypothetical protein [Streptomyces sp. NBC_01728]MCX4593744.1 hypothetical protein [Streptomyces sp. NBC_01549]
MIWMGQVSGAYDPGSGVLGGVEVGHPGGRGACGLGKEFVCVVELPGGLFGFGAGSEPGCGEDPAGSYEDGGAEGGGEPVAGQPPGGHGRAVKGERGCAHGCRGASRALLPPFLG